MDPEENRARTGLQRAEHHENSESSAVLAPPSTSSSPSHEFSFTISLHSSNPNTATETPNSSSTVDMSPADEIFFHGHLLPLHLISRSSNNSADGFTLHVRKDLVLDEPKNKNPSLERGNPPRQRDMALRDSKIACKSKSFSLSGMPRWRRAVSAIRGWRDTSPSLETSKKKQSKKSLVLDDVSQLVKRYIRMARPLLFLKKNNPEQERHGSFSGNLSQRKTSKNDSHVMSGRVMSEHFSSAPASMRTSPTNSGPLAPIPAGSLRTGHSSTMEELQAAIQAAIAHCKKSTAAAEEGKVVKA